MMRTYLTYTYKGDQNILVSSVRILRKQTQDRIIIVDDGFNPMDKATYDALQAIPNLTIEVSSHNRQGNLIGQEHTLYHAHKMRELAPTADDVVVKFDPDTLIFDLGWLKRFEDNHDSVLMGGFKNHINYLIGMCYSVKGGKSLEDYMHDVEDYPSWLRCFEDFEVGNRYYRLTGRDPHKITRVDLTRNNGWCLCDFRSFNKELFKGLSIWNGGFLGKSEPNVKSSMAKAYKAIADAYCTEVAKA